MVAWLLSVVTSAVSVSAAAAAGVFSLLITLLPCKFVLRCADGPRPAAPPKAAGRVLRAATPYGAAVGQLACPPTRRIDNKEDAVLR